MRHWLPILLLLLSPAATAGAARPCAYFLPEVDDEVLLAFQTGDARDPIAVGELWRDTKAAPEPMASLPAPSALAADLLDARLDRHPGSVARRLSEAVAAELERLHEQLDRVYESSFVAKARGGVFAANVDASIAQMEAYADLLDEVTSAVDAWLAAHLAGDDPKRERADARLLGLVAALLDFELALREPGCD